MAWVGWIEGCHAAETLSAAACSGGAEGDAASSRASLKKLVAQASVQSVGPDTLDLSIRTMHAAAAARVAVRGFVSAPTGGTTPFIQAYTGFTRLNAQQVAGVVWSLARTRARCLRVIHHSIATMSGAQWQTLNTHGMLPHRTNMVAYSANALRVSHSGLSKALSRFLAAHLRGGHIGGATPAVLCDAVWRTTQIRAVDLSLSRALVDSIVTNASHYRMLQDTCAQSGILLPAAVVQARQHRVTQLARAASHGTPGTPPLVPPVVAHALHRLSPLAVSFVQANADHLASLLTPGAPPQQACLAWPPLAASLEAYATARCVVPLLYDAVHAALQRAPSPILPLHDTIDLAWGCALAWDTCLDGTDGEGLRQLLADMLLRAVERPSAGASLTPSSIVKCIYVSSRLLQLGALSDDAATSLAAEVLSLGGLLGGHGTVWRVSDCLMLSHALRAAAEARPALQLPRLPEPCLSTGDLQVAPLPLRLQLLQSLLRLQLAPPRLLLLCAARHGAAEGVVVEELRSPAHAAALAECVARLLEGGAVQRSGALGGLVAECARLAALLVEAERGVSGAEQAAVLRAAVQLCRVLSHGDVEVEPSRRALLLQLRGVEEAACGAVMEACFEEHPCLPLSACCDVAATQQHCPAVDESLVEALCVHVTRAHRTGALEVCPEGQARLLRLLVPLSKMNLSKRCAASLSGCAAALARTCLAVE